jgi:hypothetical protein
MSKTFRASLGAMIPEEIVGAKFPLFKIEKGNLAHPISPVL